jgi:hypothetical protein
MVRQFERCLKELMDAYQQAGALWFITFETFAGDTAEYTTVVPVMKFGDLMVLPFQEKRWAKRDADVCSARSLAATLRRLVSTQRHR